MTMRSGIAAAALAALLAGCGGGGQSVAPRASAPNGVARATATIKLTIPARTTPAGVRRAQYVSPATQAISFAFGNPSNGGVAVEANFDLTPASNPNCVANLVSALVCTLSVAVQPGSYSLNVSTYDALLDGNGNPTGNLLSTNLGFPATITAGQPNVLPLTLSGVATSVAVTAWSASGVTGSQAGGYTVDKCLANVHVTVVGLDADGNFILGPGAPTPALTSGTAALTVLQPAPASPNTFVLTPNGTPQGLSIDQLTAVVSPGYTSPAATNVNLTFNADVCGNVTTLAGAAGSAGAFVGALLNARFNSPVGVAVAPSGTIYVADTFNNEIRSINLIGGNVAVFAGTGAQGTANGAGLTQATFYHPNGIAVDAAGNLYVADTLNHLIRKITPAGVVSTLAGTGSPGSADGPGASAQFNFPLGVAVDAGGNVYVADASNDEVRKITATGLVSTLAGSPGQAGSSDGQGTAAKFNQPAGIAVDANGNLYVADYNNSTIRKITPGGYVTTFAGTAGAGGTANGQGSAAGFMTPFGIAVDNSGTLYVADTNNQLIRKITSGGLVSTLAGSSNTGSSDGAGANASFYYPEGIAVDNAGDVYVGDSSNDTIRLIK